MNLPNDTKILFCNTMDAMLTHCAACKECERYIRWGDGDLCDGGKTIIAKELAFADTDIEIPLSDNDNPIISYTGGRCEHI